MGWYQCQCGFLTERTAQLGDTVISVYHLHPSARLDGTAAIVRMADVPAPVAAGGDDARSKRGRLAGFSLEGGLPALAASHAGVAAP